MYNANKPDASELPSTGRLLRSTGIAVVVASALLVTVVLPAEYGVDPTRIGSLLGLTEMGRVKMQLAQEAEAEAEAGAQAASPPPVASTAVPTTTAPTTESTGSGRTDETVITLAPDQGAEIKLVMEGGAKVTYVWASSGGPVNFDVHADRPGTPYHGYGKGSSKREEGELVAAFTGSHGWFWRNRTGAPVTISLKTTGAYTAVKRVV